MLYFLCHSFYIKFIIDYERIYFILLSVQKLGQIEPVDG